MANEVDVFKMQVPAFARNSQSAAMQAMAGGIAGGDFGNTLGLRGGKFRFFQNGTEVGDAGSDPVDVVVFAISPHVQRIYYDGPFDMDSKEPPTCRSRDGKVPDPSLSTKVQSSTCALCPMNVKGSGRMENTKACAYKKRVLFASPDDPSGDVYAHDVNAMSMFGEQQETKNLYSFKGYYEKLAANNMNIAALVTRLSFDDAVSVPKLHFTPIRPLTEDVYNAVQAQLDNPDVMKMLDEYIDVTPQQAAIAAAGVVQEIAQVKAAAAPPPEPAPAPKRGFPKKGAEAAAPAPAPAAAPKPRGFPKKGGAAEAPVTGELLPAAPAGAAPKAGLKIDMDSLTNFNS